MSTCTLLHLPDENDVMTNIRAARTRHMTVRLIPETDGGGVCSERGYRAHEWPAWKTQRNENYPGWDASKFLMVSLK